MDFGKAKRIVVLGGAGAGKSTFARALSETLGRRLVHLDRLFLGPEWTMVDDAARADAVIWLEQPAWRRLWRTWRKTVQHRGRPRADRPDGCDEVFGWRYAAAVLMFGRWTLKRRVLSAGRLKTPRSWC